METLHEKRRHLMVENQLRTNRVTDAAVLEAFAAVPRESFLPDARTDLAYIDEDLPINGGGDMADRFLIEPMIFARMVQALAPDPAETVLLLGAGCGYGAAVLAKMTQSVLAVESDPDLVAEASQKLIALDMDNAVILHGAPADGYAAEAPYQSIIIEGAVEYIPDALRHQLGVGGRLVAVLRPPMQTGRAICITRTGKNKFTEQILFDANTPLLPGFEAPQQFSFGT